MEDPENKIDKEKEALGVDQVRFIFLALTSFENSLFELRNKYLIS